MASPNEHEHNQAELERERWSWFGLRALSAFDRDERGTAMTEFIITLPVFIIIWVGMLNLYQVERQSVRVKIEAGKQMWVNAMDVADGGLMAPFDSGVPLMAAANAMGDINSYPSENGDWMAQIKNLRMMGDGSVGESKGAMLPLDLTGEDPSGNVPGENLSAYPQDMLDDSRWNMLTSASGALSVYALDIPLSFIGPNQTPAAGMRYGMSVGYQENTFEVAGRSRTYKAAYDVLNTPVDKPGFIEDLIVVPGFSRLMAEDDPCLSNVLSLNTDMGYMSNCR
ncbi:hypothetical protein FIV42_13910 [Persicimonas caeni]|uniref:Uncharacterized protein n=1 Tax=Persicimonas caeni TaxID=2292766 RepID=A0A4Y6PUK9_PERCE|nr:hypothetical protein [Persicimonas caeni]QDG51799.1 hypothetical protein FIV42_13910 [Persicimonas caeni]QED33020.1 hypothetical protein FRD00_13905 [Persicimonas caeni]